jgi:hypothetical protein
MLITSKKYTKIKIKYQNKKYNLIILYKYKLILKIYIIDKKNISDSYPILESEENRPSQVQNSLIKIEPLKFLLNRTLFRLFL